MHFFNFLLVCICAGPARLVRASHTGKHNVTVDDDSSDIVYTGNWSVVQSDLAIGGSMHTTTDPDAFVTYTYSGMPLNIIVNLSLTYNDQVVIFISWRLYWPTVHGEQLNQ